MPTGIYIRTKEHREKLSKLRKGKYVGSKSFRWKGGKHIDDKGYVLIWNLSHPHTKNRRYVLEHRLVMENHIGRYLTLAERVHHINGKRSDNRIENLILFPSNSKHIKNHFPNGITSTLSKKAEQKRKLAISKAHKGKKLSEEHRKKLSESHKNPSQEIRIKMSNARKGKTLSKNIKQKMSASQFKRWAITRYTNPFRH